MLRVCRHPLSVINLDRSGSFRLSWLLSLLLDLLLLFPLDLLLLCLQCQNNTRLLEDHHRIKIYGPRKNMFSKDAMKKYILALTKYTAWTILQAISKHINRKITLHYHLTSYCNRLNSFTTNVADCQIGHQFHKGYCKLGNFCVGVICTLSSSSQKLLPRENKTHMPLWRK